MNWLVVVGLGLFAATLVGIVGFLLAVRTGVSGRRLVIVVGTLAGVSTTAVLLVPSVRTVGTAVAFAVLVGFPVYTLFWTATEFVDRIATEEA